MDNVINLLNMHHNFFFAAKKYADLTAQPTPEDSRAWSQILVSLLTGIPGLGRRKGSDLADGSDVKSANTWGAIDSPRFNGCIKAGTLSPYANNMSYLDRTPHLFFVLWDVEPNSNTERTRIWAVQTQVDQLFRDVCSLWYDRRYNRSILSNNFQLHAPINRNSNTFSNNCGTLDYPLLFEALWNGNSYKITYYAPEVLTNGFCH